MNDSFHPLKMLKLLRTTMEDNRLNDLIVLNVEKEEAKSVNLNKGVDAFLNMKQQRYPLK